ncbi:hypothetical protein EYC59_00560 [Candidatus Saccharibacteria bacterium]|nr:MAG: hypothetical protein EYC59_00560 [Candidatus Saccharibacteria bacterium]
MGSYNSFFYGTAADQSLVAGTPRPIRSDEWVVNTQMTLAQSMDGFQRINTNIGNGQDMSVVLDVPYKEWSTIFRPHNLGFFFLPFEYAFSLKWWLMGYFLILAAYFFVINLLPGKRLIASLIGLTLFFSGFVQWWYQYITLGPLYYSLAIMAIFLLIVKARSVKQRLLWGALMAYLLTCFALVQYPPFQIPCALVMAAFCVGILLREYGKQRSQVWKILLTAGLAAVVAGATTLLFIHTRQDVIHTIQNTVYPGNRLTISGGYDAYHLFSGNYTFLSQFYGKIKNYTPMNPGMWNQSELSNFIYLMPFLVLPACALLYRNFRRKSKIEWPILLTMACLVLFCAWLFVPHLDLVGKLTLLERVPTNRLLIGFGLLNIVFLALFIQLYSATKYMFKKWVIYLFSAAVLAVEIIIGLHNHHAYPAYISTSMLLLFSLPIPFIVCLLLFKKFKVALIVLFGFSFISTFAVNPVYHGTAVLSKNPLVQEVREVGKQTDARWIVENGFLENFAAISGEPSLTGVYTYPQLGIWQQLDHSKQEGLYNRYAHVTITLNRSSDTAAPVLESPAADHFGVSIGACSPFLAKENVRYVVTEVPLTSRCSRQISKVQLPDRVLFVYRLEP